MLPGTSIVAAKSVGRAPRDGAIPVSACPKDPIQVLSRFPVCEVIEVALDPGMGAGRAHARADRSQPPLQLGEEQQVGQFGLGIRRVGPVATPRPVQVIQVQGPRVVRPRTDHDHPVIQSRKKQVGQREVAEVVRCEAQLYTVGAQAEGQAQGSGVVDQYVDRT